MDPSPAPRVTSVHVRPAASSEVIGNRQQRDRAPRFARTDFDSALASRSAPALARRARSFPTGLIPVALVPDEFGLLGGVVVFLASAARGENAREREEDQPCAESSGQAFGFRSSLHARSKTVDPPLHHRSSRAELFFTRTCFADAPTSKVRRRGTHTTPTNGLEHHVSKTPRHRTWEFRELRPRAPAWSLAG